MDQVNLKPLTFAVIFPGCWGLPLIHSVFSSLSFTFTSSVAEVKVKLRFIYTVDAHAAQSATKRNNNKNNTVDKKYHFLIIRRHKTKTSSSCRPNFVLPTGTKFINHALLQLSEDCFSR